MVCERTKRRIGHEQRTPFCSVLTSRLLMRLRFVGLSGRRREITFQLVNLAPACSCFVGNPNSVTTPMFPWFRFQRCKSQCQWDSRLIVLHCMGGEMIGQWSIPSCVAIHGSMISTSSNGHIRKGRLGVADRTVFFSGSCGFGQLLDPCHAS